MKFLVHFYLVSLNGCYGHNCVLGGSHIQYYFVFRGVIGLILS